MSTLCIHCGLFAIGACHACGTYVCDNHSSYNNVLSCSLCAGREADAERARRHAAFEERNVSYQQERAVCLAAIHRGIGRMLDLGRPPVPFLAQAYEERAKAAAVGWPVPVGTSEIRYIGVTDRATLHLVKRVVQPRLLRDDQVRWWHQGVLRLARDENDKPTSDFYGEVWFDDLIRVAEIPTLTRAITTTLLG